ncbi:MAG TPA: hypothetical protein QF604_23505 [Candidatus Latescibacteria bacterium]|jgi:dihydroorotase|nr:hypothetical protein [Candidatus Latescibacterota bacterium]MDP7631620.1 hypothetical protein [Candidatus Latescibacterota bacterium]HJN30886.1 hypothetical protein [Candidatus Latescibacterota bacterium]
MMKTARRWTCSLLGFCLWGLIGSLSIVESAAAQATEAGSDSIQFTYDLLLAGGHVIDPAHNVDGVFDVAIVDSVIVAVAEHTDPTLAERVIDVQGLYVTPGLIDLHAHVFWDAGSGYSRWGGRCWSYSDSYGGVRPDDHAFRSGVTTVVDAGSSGWRTFPVFHDRVIADSEVRVLAFLNIVGAGMDGSPAEQDLNDMDARLTAMMAQRFEDVIVGVKLAHFRGPNWEPTRRAMEAGEEAQIPVMIDFGGSDPRLQSVEVCGPRRSAPICTWPA